MKSMILATLSSLLLTAYAMGAVTMNCNGDGDADLGDEALIAKFLPFDPRAKHRVIEVKAVQKESGKHVVIDVDGRAFESFKPATAKQLKAPLEASYATVTTVKKKKAFVGIILDTQEKQDNFLMGAVSRQLYDVRFQTPEGELLVKYSCVHDNGPEKAGPAQLND
jgi:hypothetical protein